MIDILFYTSLILLLVVVIFWGSDTFRSPIFQKIILNLLIFKIILVVIIYFVDKSINLDDVLKIYTILFLSILVLKFPDNNTKFKTTLIWVGLYTIVMLLSIFTFD